MFENRKAKGEPQPEFRVCCACNKEKHAASEFYWSVQKNGTYPSGRCKECSSKYLKEYRSTRKAKYAEYARISRLKNPERHKEIQRKSDLKDEGNRKARYLESLSTKILPNTKICRDCGVEKNTRIDFYNCEQPCKKCRVAKASFFRRTSEGKDRRKKEYLKNPAEAKARAKKWKLANPEKVSASASRIRKTEEGRFRQRIANHSRRAKKKLATVNGALPITQEWFRELCQTHGNRCYYCWDSQHPLTMDHIKPLALGGLHVRENILPSCKSCNCKKSDFLIEEWRPWIDIPLYGLELASA